MSGGATAALVIGGVVIVGTGGLLYVRHRRKVQALAPRINAAGMPVPQNANQAVGDLMATVGPATATGSPGAGRLGGALNTLGAYQSGLDNFVGNAAGGLVGKYLGSGVGNAFGGGIKSVAHYANPVAITKDVNKVLKKVPVLGKLFSW